MENKLQELTQKLYDEGLSKGRAEAESLLADARDQAAKIISDAKNEADRIKKTARTGAEELHKNTLTEVSLAGKQLIGDLKSNIQNLIIAKTVNEGVKESMTDPQFIKELLLKIASNWQGSGQQPSLKAVLPENMKDKLDTGFEQSVKQALNDGIEISYSDKVRTGFNIGPKEGGYFISFTDESFDALLGEYLRPKVNEVLYGTNE